MKTHRRGPPLRRSLTYLGDPTSPSIWDVTGSFSWADPHSREARAYFKNNRLNGDEKLDASRPWVEKIPDEKNIVWTKGEKRSDGYVYGVEDADGYYHYECRYDADAEDLEWMRQTDCNYLKRLLRKGNLQTHEPDVWRLREMDQAQNRDIGKWWSEKLTLSNIGDLLSNSGVDYEKFKEEERVRVAREQEQKRKAEQERKEQRLREKKEREERIRKAKEEKKAKKEQSAQVHREKAEANQIKQLKEEDKVIPEKDQRTKNINKPLLQKDTQSVQYKADEQAKLLNESINPLNETKMFFALQQLERFDYGQLTDPTAILHHLMQASCGPLSDHLDIRYKQMILQTAVPFIYVAFLQGQQEKALHIKESKRQEYLQSIQEERKRLEVRQIDQKEHSHNSYRFVLDMLETILALLLDPKRYEQFEAIMKQLFKESFLCVSVSIFICSKVAIKSGITVAKTGGDILSKPLFGLGCFEDSNMIFRDLSYFKKPISNVASIVKQSYQALGTVAKVKWYVNSMMLYHYGITTLVTGTLTVLKEELQVELKNQEGSDWHILYAGIESLLNIMLKTSDTKIMEQAFYGDIERPGLEYYIDFGDRRSKQTSKLKLKRIFKGLTTLTPDQTWRVREHAIGSCLMLCATWGGDQHANSQDPKLIQKRKQIVNAAADLILERRLHETNGLVRKTLNCPEYVLKVFRQKQQEYDQTDDNQQVQMESVMRAIQDSFERHKTEYLEDLRAQQAEIAELKRTVDQHSESLTERTEKENELLAREKELREEMQSMSNIMGEVEELRAILLEQSQLEKALLLDLMKVQQRVSGSNEKPKQEVSLVPPLALPKDLLFKEQEISTSLESDATLEKGTPKTLLDEIKEAAKKRSDSSGLEEDIVEEVEKSRIAVKPALSPAQRKEALDKLAEANKNLEEFNRELTIQVDRQDFRRDNIRYPFMSVLVQMQFDLKDFSNFTELLASKLKEMLFKCVLHHLGMNEAYLIPLEHQGVKLQYIGREEIPEAYMNDIGRGINEKLRKEGEIIDYLSNATEFFSRKISEQYQTQIERMTKESRINFAEVITRRICQYLDKNKFVTKEEFENRLSSGILTGQDWIKEDTSLATCEESDKAWQANELIDQIGLKVGNIFFIHKKMFVRRENKYGYRFAEEWEYKEKKGEYYIEYRKKKAAVEHTAEKLEEKLTFKESESGEAEQDTFTQPQNSYLLIEGHKSYAKGRSLFFQEKYKEAISRFSTARTLYKDLIHQEGLEEQMREKLAKRISKTSNEEKFSEYTLAKK